MCLLFICKVNYICLFKKFYDIHFSYTYVGTYSMGYLEVSWFSLFYQWVVEDGKDGCQIRWEVPLPTQPSYCSKYAFLNPILQLTNPQVIFVKICIIIWHLFFINRIASTMLVMTYLLVCTKCNFKTPLVTRKQSTSTMRHT